MHAILLRLAPVLGILIPTMAVFGQPVLTVADLVPPLGSTAVRDFCNFIPPGPDSADFVFDATGITSFQQFQYDYLEPTTTPFIADLPQATHCYTDAANPNTYVYTLVTATEVQYVGLRYLTGPFDFTSDPQIWYQLPMTHNLSFTDTWESTAQDFQGSNYVRTGTTTVSYNGHGTVILPSGTFTDCARVETYEVFTDAYANDTLPYIHTTVNYHKAGIPVPVFTTFVRLGVITQDYDTLGAYTYAINDASVGLQRLEHTALLARVFPNPATDQVTVQLLGTPESAITVTVLDATGRTVRPPEVLPRTPSPAIELQVGELRPGLYVLKIDDALGRSSSVCLTVQ